MVWFTDSPLERMMSQPSGAGPRIGGHPDPPAQEQSCDGCPYGRGSPCIGVCMKELIKKQQEERPK